MTTTIDLSSFFQTKSQANDFSARLATISEQTFQLDFNLEKSLMEQFGINKKDKFITLLRDNSISVDATKAIKDFITKLQETIATLTVVPISLAFEPKEQTLKALSEWFAINLKRQVLFDITVDRKLIAGAAITFNGKYKDFSIKAKFDETVTRILTKPTQIHAVPGPTQNTNNLHLGR